MTALVTFSQVFQHFHLVTPDRFAPPSILELFLLLLL